jgi:transcriptional regulator with XRE-family HTH domain
MLCTTMHFGSDGDSVTTLTGSAGRGQRVFASIINAPDNGGMTAVTDAQQGHNPFGSTARRKPGIIFCPTSNASGMAPPDDNDPERGARIGKARAQAGLTKEQVAERLGHRRLRRAPEDVTRWEAGEPLTAREIQGLARVVGESSRYLETGVEDTGVRIARQRARVGLEQAELAAQMDVTERNVQFWEQGRNVMRKHVGPLARALDTTPEYLLFGTDAVPAAENGQPPEGDSDDESDDRRRAGGMRGFDEVARRIDDLRDDLRGEDDDATISALRADVRALREVVQLLLDTVQEQAPPSPGEAEPGTGDSREEGAGEA